MATNRSSSFSNSSRVANFASQMRVDIARTRIEVVVVVLARLFASCSGRERPANVVVTILFSKLVCEPQLENMLHQAQLIGNGQRTTRGRRTTVASSRIRKVEGTAIAERKIPKIGVAILRT
jgi:hypothetical protein